MRTGDGITARALAESGPSGLIVGRPAVLRLALMLAGIGLLTAGALCSVPFYPVPLTMQTLAVLVVGGLLGPRMGAGAVMGYVALGVAGAPVFHGGLGGPAVLAGPTGGYLMGFVVAACVMGLAGRRARLQAASGRSVRLRRLRVVAVLAAGAILAEAAVYAFGVPWLALYMGSLADAVASGVVPFLLGDALKMAVAIAAVQGGERVLSRWSPLPL